MKLLSRNQAFDPPQGSYELGIGKQRFIGQLDRVWLTPAYAAAHMLVIGQTGAGKTKLIEGLCRQFLESGQGFCLLDLHGDLASELRDFAADMPEREIVWLDAADPKRTVTFNPLESGGADPATVRLEVIAAFRRHWADSWGPRLADLLTHSLAVLQANGLTLAETPLLLGDKDVRRKLLRGDGVEAASRDYFELRYDPLSKRDQVLMSESTMNKVGALLADYRVRTFLGDTSPTLNLRRAIDEQQVVLARIPRGVLVENADLLGSLLLAAVHTAALARVEHDPARRRPYVLVLDEAQIASETFPQLLSGSRAFGLAAICGVQYLDQLPRPLAEALLANCRVRACFRVSRRDAERLSRELFRADGDHIKYAEADLLGSRKSKPMYWNVGEEWEYAIRELQDQDAGECVIQLGRELPWFAESAPVQPAESRRHKAAPLTKSRTQIARAIDRRRARLTNQPTNSSKGGDPYDDDDAIEALE